MNPNFDHVHPHPTGFTSVAHISPNVNPMNPAKNAIAAPRHVHSLFNFMEAPMAQEYDPNGADPHAGGAKLDGGKPLAWLMLRSFSLALHEVIGVTTYGAEKYTPEGWAQVPNGENRYMEAGCRHLMAHARGEHTDPQTGFPHRAHAIWNLLCALELELRTKEVKRQAEEACAYLGIKPTPAGFHRTGPAPAPIPAHHV